MNGGREGRSIAHQLVNGSSTVRLRDVLDILYRQILVFKLLRHQPFHDLFPRLRELTQGREIVELISEMADARAKT